MRKKLFVLVSGVLFICWLAGCQLDEQKQREPEMNVQETENDETMEVNKGVKEEIELESKRVDGDADRQGELEESKGSFVVKIIDREGVDIGTAEIKEEEDGVHIRLDAHQLPEGLHGFHIHEHGLCDVPSFESAGGHFNPEGKEHGFDHPQGPHAGDLENIEVQADGTVQVEIINDRVTLQKGEPNSLLREGGTSFIIHANPDDYVSQPAGDAGERIACGVIKEMNEKHKE